MASIFQRSDGSWRVQIRNKRQTKGNWTFDSRAEAEAWATAYEAAPVVITPEVKTMADLMDRYSLEISPSKGGGRWEIIRIMALRSAFITIEAATMDGAHFAEWRDRRLKQVSPATVNREMNLLSAVISHAISEWRLPLACNPIRLIRRPKQPAHRTRRVSDAERNAIIKELGWNGISAPDDLREWIGWGYCFALETMMRKGEVLAPTWEHVHAKKVYLPNTKNGDARWVPLTQRARVLLSMLSPGQPTDVVVPVTSGTFTAYFIQACKGAAVEDMHFHDSRREALSQRSKKLDILELMKAVGHRDMRSLAIYYEADADDMADKL
jgi:integrase